MLQSAFVTQIFTAIISLSLLGFGLYFFDKYDETYMDKYRIIAWIMFVATVVGGIYFFYNIITTTPFTFGKMFLAILKAIIVLVIGAEIIMFFAECIDEPELQFGTIVVISLCCILIMAVGGLINDSIYHKNVVFVEEQRYSDEKFELVPIFNDKDIEGSINVVVAPSVYYNVSVEESNNSTTDVANKELYEICYIDDGEKLYTKLDAKNTSIIPIENGEKAYYVIKTYMSYYIDNNQDPPVECYQEYTYKYELHIPQKTNNKVEETSKFE